EVREPGQALQTGMIYDANRVMLKALLHGLGCVVSDLGIRPDRAAALADTLAAVAAEHDLIVTSGGVSTGEEDHVKAAVEQHGRLDFWRLAIKPGRPVALGQVHGVPLIGLPGNPVAAALTFAILARPLILRLSGAAIAPPLTVPGPAAANICAPASPATAPQSSPTNTRKTAPASCPRSCNRTGSSSSTRG